MFRNVAGLVELVESKVEKISDIMDMRNAVCKAEAAKELNAVMGTICVTPKGRELELKNG